MSDADNLSDLIAEAERLFPIIPYSSREQREQNKGPHPMSVPWQIAELAYSVYASRYGRSQSLSRIAERGGFHAGEMDGLLPDWRERCAARDKLTAELATTKADLANERAVRDRRELAVNLALAKARPYTHPGTNAGTHQVLGEIVSILEGKGG